MLGEAYKNDKLTTFKPHHISAASFKTLKASKVALIPHMLKVANISSEFELSFIISSKKVNVDDTADKSLFGTAVQSVDQPKAPTGRKPKKKKISSSSEPKTSHYVCNIRDLIRVLDASELAEELRNRPDTVDVEK
ncbi:hypothetical protein Tco_0869554, partial [Tanacetum coccineum]